jgi:hypothetical protein
MIYGWRGVAKTRLAMKLGHTIASTGSFLGWSVQKAKKVCYVDGELGLGAMRRRFKAIQLEAPFSPKGDYFKVLSKDHCGGQLWNLSDPSKHPLYQEAFADRDVIIIDNILSSVFPLFGRDDDVAQWQRIMPFLFNLRDQGKTVILIHHTGKGGTQLGTSVKENWLDTSILLKTPDSPRDVNGCEFEFHFTKTRDVKKCDAPSLYVQLLDDDLGVPRWWWEKLGDARTQQVKNMKELGVSKRDAAKELGISLREVASLWGN